MANSRFEYVKTFEVNNYLLPQTYIVVRIDGRGFHKLSSFYKFDKPNDSRALSLMNRAAVEVMKKLTDIALAYGDSDEYSFVFDKNTSLFERREAKIVSTIASTFTSYYTFYWSEYFPDQPLDPSILPTFDSRAVVYPSLKQLRDYLAWRQADCHINNLYNTTFWALVLRGSMSPQEAEQALQGTVAADKNEILFSKFQINYNNEEEMFKKGTVIVREYEVVASTDELSKRQTQRLAKKRSKAEITIHHCDIIGDAFWNDRPWLLAP